MAIHKRKINPEDDLGFGSAAGNEKPAADQ